MTGRAHQVTLKVNIGPRLAEGDGFFSINRTSSDSGSYGADATYWDLVELPRPSAEGSPALLPVPFIFIYFSA